MGSALCLWICVSIRENIQSSGNLQFGPILLLSALLSLLCTHKGLCSFRDVQLTSPPPPTATFSTDPGNNLVNSHRFPDHQSIWELLKAYCDFPIHSMDLSIISSYSAGLAACQDQDCNCVSQIWTTFPFGCQLYSGIYVSYSLLKHQLGPSGSKASVFQSLLATQDYHSDETRRAAIRLSLTIKHHKLLWFLSKVQLLFLSKHF